jgi:hypothetical protein
MVVSLASQPMSSPAKTSDPLEHGKLFWTFLQVDVHPNDIQAMIDAGKSRLPPNHTIRSISYLEVEGGGCLLAMNSFKQTYFNQWQKYIVQLLDSAKYAEMLNMDSQRQYKCHFNSMKKQGKVLLDLSQPLAQLPPLATLQIKKPDGGGKRTKVVLPNGQPGVQIMQQTVLERVKEPEPPRREQVKAQLMLKVEDPFSLQDPAQALRAFLTDPKPWNDPPAPPKRTSKEQTFSFAGRLHRLSANSLIKHWDCFKAFLPPCVRGHDKYLPILAQLSLPAEQAQGIEDLSAFYSAKGWTGFSGLLPSLDMQMTFYGLQCSFPAEKSTCVFEAFRRALKQEETLRKLAEEMLTVVDGAQSLAPIPSSAQQSIRLLLDFSCGISGPGEELWAPLPQEQAGGLSCLDEGASAGVLEVRGWLEELRALRPEAFKPRYVMGTQVGWMLSSLALAFANRGGDLRAEGALGALLGALKTEWGARETVYLECLKPIWKYGGLLTRWAVCGLGPFCLGRTADPALHRVLDHFCNISRSLRGTGKGAPFPDVQLAKLGHKGRLVDPLSKMVLNFGHLDTKAPPLLPFPLLSCSLELKPPQELDAMAEAQHRLEEGAILDMLAALGVDRDACPVLKMMYNAHAQVNIRLRSGSTKDLPPTASEPEAVYNPAALYADFEYPRWATPYPRGP